MWHKKSKISYFWIRILFDKSMFRLGAAGDSSAYVAGDRWLARQTIDHNTAASHSGVSCCRNKAGKFKAEIVDAINIARKYRPTRDSILLDTLQGTCN